MVFILKMKAASFPEPLIHITGDYNVNPFNESVRRADI